MRKLSVNYSLKRTDRFKRTVNRHRTNLNTSHEISLVNSHNSWPCEKTSTSASSLLILTRKKQPSSQLLQIWPWHWLRKCLPDRKEITNCHLFPIFLLNQNCFELTDYMYTILINITNRRFNSWVSQFSFIGKVR